MNLYTMARRRIVYPSRRYRREVPSAVSSRVLRLGRLPITYSYSGLSFLLAAMLLLVLTLLCYVVVPVNSKEIVATREWQLLGENETVAAGMHIRVDLTTGEKWVKLPEDESMEDQQEVVQKPNERIMSSSSNSLAIVTNDGDLQRDQSAAAEDTEPNYDFEMMYRTLSQLPDEDKESMQLPRLTSSSSKIASLEPEARAHFEARLKRIWEERQATLQRIQSENVVDLPQLLKERIDSLRAYLLDPMTHLQECTETTTDEPGSDNNTAISNIIQVLQDLEYQLADLDMTRDFHTLGGWPFLTALLCDYVHPNLQLMADRNVSNTAIDENFLLRERIHRIQMHAAWALGTAVKNTGEFLSYVLEPVTVVDVTASTSTMNDSSKDGTSTVSTTTALDLVLQQLRTTVATTTTRAHTEGERQKLSKIIYCLGSFLRGNRPAQLHFVDDQGPSSLSAALKSMLSHLMDQTATKTTALIYRKLAQRLLQLASDTVLDVSLHATETTDMASQSDDARIVQAYTDAEWCDAVQMAFQLASDNDNNNKKAQLRLVEDVLPTIHTLVSHCRSQWISTTTKGTETFIHKLERLKENNSDNKHDSEVVDLIETALRRLREDE